jgi:flagellar hook-associated protein 2
VSSSGTINNYGNVLLAAGSNTIDVQTLLSAAITAASAPLTALQTQQTALEKQQAALESIQSDINTLQNASQAITDPAGSLNALTATSSNSTLLTASADSTAVAGAHSVVVNSLATTSSYYSSAQSLATSTLASGSFQLVVGGAAAGTVTINSSDNTLNGLAAAINSQSLGVSASVVNDANGARLVLVSKTSGAAGNITISGDSSGLGFQQAVGGANASLTVDGVPLSSTSNTVTGAIPGVTLNLNNAAVGSNISVSVTPDVQQATDALTQFAAAYNKVIGDLNTQFSVQSDGSGGGPLEADNTLREVQNQLLSAVTASVSGNNGLVNLASLGLNLNTDGTLSLDSGTLTNALSTNFNAAQNLLQGTGGVGSFLTNALTLINDPTNGAVTLDLQGMSQNNQSLTTQISSLQVSLNTQEQSLTAEYAKMQTTLDEMPQLQQQITQQLSAFSG